MVTSARMLGYCYTRLGYGSMGVCFGATTSTSRRQVLPSQNSPDSRLFLTSGGRTRLDAACLPQMEGVTSPALWACRRHQHVAGVRVEEGGGGADGAYAAARCASVAEGAVQDNIADHHVGRIV